MSIKKNTNFGAIKIADETVAMIIDQALSQSYGIVGMTSKNLLIDKYYEILKKENYTKGIEIKNKNGLEVDVYVVVSYGVKISEVLLEAQKRIKYDIESTLGISLDKINIYVQGVR